MQQLLCIALLAFMPLLAISQPPESIPIDTLDPALFQEETDLMAKSAVAQIMAFAGLRPIYTIVPARVPTALAYIKENKQYIAYNPEFIKELNNKTHTRWGVISVLAHEIGHHMLGHTLKNKPATKAEELDADRYSGFILQRMGATKAQALLALKTFGHTFDTLHHPPLEERLKAVEAGWQSAATPRQLNLDQSIVDTTNRKDFELKYRVKILKDDNVYKVYKVDNSYPVIMVDQYGNTLEVGVFVPALDTQSYEWYFYHGATKYGVDIKGKIWLETLHGGVIPAGFATPQ